MQVTTIGLDIAKNVFQVHGIDAEEKIVVRKQLRRGQVIRFFEELSPCLVGLEAWPGLRHAYMIKTSDHTYCIIAEWPDMETLANARPHLIKTLARSIHQSTVVFDV